MQNPSHTDVDLSHDQN